MNIKALLIAVGVVFLAGCGPVMTQSPGQGLSPVNAVSEGEDQHLLLFGHDVVNYFTDAKPAMGSPEHKSVVKGVTFWFASAEHKTLFDADPEKYTPQYGAYCTNGIAYGIPWGGSADTWQIADGKLFIFGGQASMDAFLLDPEANYPLAKKYWQEEVNESNAFFQRVKRMVFRVPHYQSGAELAELVRKAKAGG